MYRGLYKLADIGETGSQPRMFALLLHQEIDRNFTVMFFQGFLKKNETLGEALGRLVKFGWLEDTGNGYRMHPVIAESLCTKDFSEAEFQPFWERAQGLLLPETEKEDIYLKAAVEGFRECYPPEHPKRIAAEQRLKERQGE